MKHGCQCHGVPPPCIFCDTGLEFTPEEIDAIVDLGKRQDLSAAKVIKQALRVYQLHVLGEPDLSKVAPSQPQAASDVVLVSRVREVLKQWREKVAAMDAEANRTWDDDAKIRVQAIRELADEIDRALPPHGKE